MTTAGKVQRELRERTPAAGLSRDFYTDDSVYALDLRYIYYREWLFAAHTAELPKTGSYLTLQIGDYPILLTRAADGLVRAFVNSCRHRGSRLCQAASGISPKLVCPYHQWTYELNGLLFAARKMAGGFDRSNYSLRQVHCQTVAGYIFVCVGEEAPDFTAVRAQVEPYLLPHRLADARVAYESTIIEDGNWKLTWENNRECFHCSANHPELARTYPDTPTVASADGAGADPLIIEHWKQCEAAGLASRFQLSVDGQVRTARMPLIGEAVSYTLSGHAAVKRPLSDAVPATSRTGALLFFHYPSTWNHILADHAISFRVLPLDSQRTQLTTKWLVHRDAVEGVDYDLNQLTHVWLATNQQDQRIVHENQIGINAPTYEPGPWSSVQEAGVAQFVDWYSRKLTNRLSEEKGVALA